MATSLTTNPLLAPPAVPPPHPPVTHDVTIVTTRKLAQARVLGVPPEEFGIERGARSIRDCNYCFHEVVRVGMVADARVLPSWSATSLTFTPPKESESAFA